ncbi:MAG TPA: ROK family protein, partial [Pyrinomonadaceae bacterium]|nr:ROK family protein [Pyrinomonadaceae bacterium]
MSPHSKLVAALESVLLPHVNPNSRDNLVCAVDLGGTNLRAANIDRTGRIYERARTATPKTDKAEDIVSALVAAVRECETEGLKRGAQIQAFSVVVPGSVQVGTGVVVNAPNIPSLSGFRLAPALGAALDRPVLLENDANAAALGEMWQGAARPCKTIICFTLGTGVGGAVILDGQLWRGVDGTAGELGHTSVEPFGGVQCKCGNVGCLEVYASATAIVRMTREGLTQNSSSSLNSIPAAELTSAGIASAATARDPLALEVFRKAGVYLGIAMANAVNIFNPEMIVVGGGVSAAWNLLAQPARDEVAKRAFPVPAARCQIVSAECGDDAGLLGAAWL